MKKENVSKKRESKGKKQKISLCKIVGFLFRGIGVFCIIFLIAGEYDISASWRSIIQTQAGLAIVACVAFLLDAIFSDVRRLKRVLFPFLITFVAGVYAVLHKIVSIPRYCYLIKQECGTYKKTYRHCQQVIDKEDGYPYDL